MASPSLVPAHPKHPHLPEGRAPGPQSERRKGNQRLGFWLLLIMAVAGVVVSILLFAGVIENEDASTTGLILLGLSVLFAFLALLIRWLGRHRNELAHLTLTSGAEEYSRGQTVQARLRVADAAKLADDTEVGLVCMEYYDTEVSTGQGQRSRGTREAVVWETWQAVDSAQQIQELAFTVPPDAPFSHEGDAISFGWRLSARENRRARVDPRTDEPVWVHP